MSTVVGRMFKVMLDTARQAGVDVASIERSYFPDGIEPGRDYSWDTYAAMTDEICDRLGDASRVIDTYAGWSHALPELGASLAHLDDPLEVARVINVDLSAPDFPGVSITFRELSHQRYTYAHVVAPTSGLRASRWGAYVTAGLLSGQPSFIGLPRAHVEIVVATVWEGHFRVTLPPREASTLTPATLGHDHVARAVGLLSTLAAERGKRHQRGEALRADVAALGLAMGAADTAEAIADVLCAFVTERAHASSAFVWGLRGPSARLLASRGDRAGDFQTVRLAAGDVVVGLLEAPASCDLGSLQPVLPLVAAALARRIVAPARWGLSPAQTQTAELLAAGASSAAIAKRLGVSVHTVDERIASVLRKAGVSRRTELVAQWRHGRATRAGAK